MIAEPLAEADLIWLGGAEDHKGIEFSDAQKGAHSEAVGGRRSGRRHMSQGGDQPGDILQLEEAVRRHAAAEMR